MTTATWLMFATWRQEDAALRNSYWMAQQTLRLAPVSAMVLDREAAIREALEHALADERVRGIALFGHGRPDAIMGSDGIEALDTRNIGLVGPRWVHAMACLTGQELVPASVAHVDFFVGYKISLIVEWEIETLRTELQEHLARMVAATTLALLAGVRDQAELRRRAAEAAEEMIDWLLENTAEDEHLGIHVLAETLVHRMVTSR